MKRSLRELRIPKEIEEALEDLVERLKESLGEFKLYLFGSYARGDWVRGISDVDIVVVSPKFRGVHPVERAAMVRKLARPGIPLEVLCYTQEELEELLKTSAFIREISSYWIELY